MGKIKKNSKKEILQLKYQRCYVQYKITSQILRAARQGKAKTVQVKGEERRHR